MTLEYVSFDRCHCHRDPQNILRDRIILDCENVNTALFWIHLHNDQIDFCFERVVKKRRVDTVYLTCCEADLRWSSLDL